MARILRAANQGFQEERFRVSVRIQKAIKWIVRGTETLSKAGITLTKTLMAAAQGFRIDTVAPQNRKKATSSAVETIQQKKHSRLPVPQTITQASRDSEEDPVHDHSHSARAALRKGDPQSVKKPGKRKYLDPKREDWGLQGSETPSSSPGRNHDNRNKNRPTIAYQQNKTDTRPLRCSRETETLARPQRFKGKIAGPLPLDPQATVTSTRS